MSAGVQQKGSVPDRQAALKSWLEGAHSFKDLLWDHFYALKLSTVVPHLEGP